MKSKKVDYWVVVWYLVLNIGLVIQTAKKTDIPFNVNDLIYTDFLDFLKLSNGIGNNFNKNTYGQKVTWNDIKVIKISKDMTDRIL